MKLLQAVTVAALLAGSAAHAETLSINAGWQGWISSNGISNGAESFSNMYTGNEDGKRYNSWAAFYIPPGAYTFASLSFSPVVYGEYGANKIGIFDVSIPLTALTDGYRPGKSVFEDLGSGVQYGTVSLLDQPKSTNLSGGALYDINAIAGSYLVIGFTNLTMNGLPPGGDAGAIYLGGFGRNQIPLQLNLEVSPVPEPGSWVMLTGGLGLLGWVARRRRKHST
jgi:hypothetical protein